MNGYFSEESLKIYSQQAAFRNSSDFSESYYDFTRCVRTNGTAYGTGGACRLGTEKEKEKDTNSPASSPKPPKPPKKLNNRAFLKDFITVSPRGIGARIEDGKIKMTSYTKYGDKVEAEYNRKEGFNYFVNGGASRGTVTDPKARIAAALAAKKIFETFVKALPDGHQIITEPYSGDGQEAYVARVKAYKRMGFGDPIGGIGEYKKMYAKKENASLVPADETSYESFIKTADNNFSEGVTSTYDWVTVLFR